MKKALLIICLLLSGQVRGGHNSIDSLKALLFKCANDSHKTQLEQQLGHQYETINMDSAFFFYRSGLKTATELQYQKEIGDAQTNLAYAYYYNGQLNESINALEQSVKAYESVDSLSDLSDAYYNLGTFLFRDGQNKLAIEAFKKGIPFAQQTKKFERMATIYNNCGLAYQYTGQFVSATYEFLKSAKLREQYNLPFLNSSFVNIGLSYQHQNRYKDALLYYKKALVLSRKTNDMEGIEITSNNIGDVFLALNAFDSSQYYYEQGFKFSGIKEKKDAANYNKKMGLLFISKKEFNQANDYLVGALSKTDTVKYTMFLTQLYQNLSLVNLEVYNLNANKENLRKSQQYGQLAVVTAKKQQLKPNLASAMQTLYRAYKASGEPAKALEYATLYIELMDSLNSGQKTAAIADMQTKYETEKKELEIELLNSQNQLSNNKLLDNEKEKTQQRYIISATLIILLLVIGLLVYSYRQASFRKKINGELEKQNAIISMQNQEKEILLKEIHHRVKNNLQIVSSLLELQSKKGNEDAKSSIIDGQNRVKAMALIHEKLYQHDQIAEIDLGEYIQQLYLQIAAVFPGKENITVEITANDIKLDIDTATPLGLILNELITNSFKYAFTDQKNELYISVVKHRADEYQLLVKENGPGLPEGFDWKQSKTLGLRLVNRLACQLYGKAEYSKAEKSTFEVTFKDTVERKKIA